MKVENVTKKKKGVETVTGQGNLVIDDHVKKLMHSLLVLVHIGGNCYLFQAPGARMKIGLKNSAE